MIAKPQVTDKPLTAAKARIYRQPKSAMQSGRAKTRFWLLEYDPVVKIADPLTGWTGNADTRQQLRMRFPTREAAEQFAKDNGIPYELELPHSRVVRQQSYSDNFRFDRVATHNLSGPDEPRKNNNDWS